MTRSVEIPDEAVRRARKAWMRMFASGPVSDPLTPMRAALEAALPYLAPAADSFEVHAIQPHGDVIYQVRKITVDVVGEFPTYEQARDHAEVWQVNSNG